MFIIINYCCCCHQFPAAVSVLPESSYSPLLCLHFNHPPPVNHHQWQPLRNSSQELQEQRLRNIAKQLPACLQLQCRCHLFVLGISAAAAGVHLGIKQTNSDRAAAGYCVVVVVDIAMILLLYNRISTFDRVVV